MAKEVKTYIIDVEYPEDQSPGAKSFAEIIGKIISDGCSANGLVSSRVKPRSRMPASYAEVVFEVDKA